MSKKPIKQIARYLRREQTQSEKVLWEALKNRELNGLKFLRQHPIRFQHYGKDKYFIADFYCSKKKLVIELDGGVHEFTKEYDEIRTLIINDLGIKVIRFLNTELNDLEGVLKRIMNS